MLQVPLEPPQLPEFRHPPSFPGGRRIRRTSTSPKDVSSSAILSVPQIPQPHSVLQTLPDSPAATTIKSPLIQGKNTATILKEEIGSAASVQNVAIPKSTEWSPSVKRRAVAEKTTTTHHHSEELAIGIPSTPTREMELVVPPLDNPFSNPGLPSDRPRTSMEEKGPQDPSADVSTVSPPSTLLHKQGFPKDVSEGDFDQPLDWSKYQNTPEYVSTHPTCALNLVCYRTGAKGCELHQIQTILESRFEDKEAFQLAIKENSSRDSASISKTLSPPLLSLFSPSRSTQK